MQIAIIIKMAASEAIIILIFGTKFSPRRNKSPLGASISSGASSSLLSSRAGTSFFRNFRGETAGSSGVVSGLFLRSVKGVLASEATGVSDI